MPLPIGQAIRELRGKLPLRELARRLEMDHARLSRIERDLDGSPTITTLERIAQGLDVEVSTIVRRAERLAKS